MAAHGFVIAAASYRFSSVAAFSAQLHDAKAAVRWLRANAAAYGIDPERIGVLGDSSGGQLAGLLGTTADRFDLEGECGSPELSSSVQAVVTRCAPTDFGSLPQEAAEVLDALFGGPPAATAPLRELASPLAHVSNRSAPLLIVHGTRDETVPFEQAERMAQKLAEHGIHQAPARGQVVRREPINWPTVTASRYSMDPARVEQLVADYLAGDSLHLVAARYGRSYTWLRATLERLGVPRRPRGGVPEPVATEEIVRLRDEECLSWAEIRQITGLTEPALSARYRNADTSGRPARRYNRLGASTNDEIRRRNDAINHLDEIRDAYWSGATVGELAEQWGVSPKTITTWVYKT